MALQELANGPLILQLDSLNEAFCGKNGAGRREVMTVQLENFFRGILLGFDALPTELQSKKVSGCAFISAALTYLQKLDGRTRPEFSLLSSRSLNDNLALLEELGIYEAELSSLDKFAWSDNAADAQAFQLAVSNLRQLVEMRTRQVGISLRAGRTLFALVGSLLLFKRAQQRRALP
jgi:hypothetical protein